MNDWFFLHFTKLASAAAAVAGLGLFWFLGGCERESGNAIGGTVTSAGKPVTFGTVTAVASDGQVYQVPIQADGRYELRGLPPGPVRVAVTSPNPKASLGTPKPATPPPQAPTAKGGGAARPSQDAGAQGKRKALTMPMEGPPPPAGPTLPQHANWFPIPGKYAQPATSGLGANAQGRTSLDIKAD